MVDLIFKKLTLKNFKSHKNTQILFDTGITIIIGKNGAGKSSILEGITYALFKKTQLNQNSLMRIDNNGKQTNMMVELQFMKNGTDYKIMRLVTPSKSVSKLFKVEDGIEILLIEGNSQVNNEIKTILNMDMNLFLNAIYIRQGQIADLIYKKPSERKKIIGNFLQINDLEEVWKDMPKIINVYKIKQERYKGMIISEDDVKHELDKNNKNLKELKIKLSEFENIKNRINIQEEKTNNQIKEIEIKKSNYLTILNNVNDKKIKVNKNKNELESISKEIDKIIEAEMRAKTLKDKINEFDDKENEMIELKSDNRFLYNDNRTLNDDIENISSIEEKCPLCKSIIDEDNKNKLIESYDKRIKSNEQKIIKNSKKIDKLKTIIDEQEKIKSDYLKLKNVIGNKDELKERQISYKEKINTEEQNIIKLERELIDNKYDGKRLEELKGQLSDIEEEKIKNSENMGIVKGKISNVEIQINKLKKDLNNFMKVKQEIKKVDEYIKLLQKIRFLYGKDGIQNKLRNLSKFLIEKNTNDFFKKFNFNYDELLIDDEFEVSLIKNNKRINVDMLSGGEKIAVALALRLGITQTISKGNINSMFLDEPTIHLDDVRVDELNGLLSNLNFIPQMFIVTHNSRLENLADNVIKIEKQNGISRRLK